MPEATPFTSFGSINPDDPDAALFTGFPYRPPVLLVDPDSPETYWTTLSGWSKDNEPLTPGAKANSIAESHRLAMELFWNSYELKGEASHDGSYYGPVSVINSGGLTTEPKDRSCIKHDDFPNQSTTDSNEIPSSPSNILSDAEVSFKIKIVRMFKFIEGGDDEFIGYGVDEYTGDLDFVRTDIFSMMKGVDEFGFTEYISVSLASSLIESFILFDDIDYTTISYAGNDFHFVCFVNGFGGDAVTRTVSTGDSTAQIDSFDSYTYPA